jgi:uncharacterized protein (UPF0276 family)
LVERDFNFPPLAELVAEVSHVRAIQEAQALIENVEGSCS